jgi:hypothetical protein
VDTETLKENLTPPEVHIMNQGMFQRYENEIPTDDFQPGDIWIMPIDPQADGTEQSDMVKIDFVDREKGEIHVKGLSRKPTFDIITFEKIEDMLTDGLVFFKLELE